MNPNKKLTIGLFGFGVIGEGIYRVLRQTPSLNAEIKKVCIKHPEKKRNAPAGLFTTVADELLSDNDINVIVELIDDADAAFGIVSVAMKNKKAVVSANKKMIAEHLAELLPLQKDNDVSFLYEASVCGSIPVIRNLEEYYDNDLLRSFSGIVNGSTNFILTKMNEEGLGYAEALKMAQKLGFAESNPSLDVEGNDALNKLTIVLQHAYGILVNPKNLICKGISCLHESDSKYASEKKLKIKLVATAKRIDENNIVAYVLPTFVDSNNRLFSVSNEFNGVLIGSKLADEQFLYGKGAGRYPTSSAVLSDIAALRYDYRYEYKKSKTGVSYELTNDYFIRIFLSFFDAADFDVNDFKEVEESYNSASRKYIIGIISFEKLIKAGWFYKNKVSVIALEEPAHPVEQINYEMTEEI